MLHSAIQLCHFERQYSISMAFYIKPPRGVIQLDRLDSICLKRLQFLLEVDKCGGNTVAMKDLVEKTSTVEYSDCLIESSPWDLASHFTLRLACCEDPEMRDFYVRAETLLFGYRWSCLTEKELYSCVKPLQRLQGNTKNTDRKHVSLAPEMRHVMTSLDALTADRDWKTLIRDYSDGGRQNSFIFLPFQMVLGLVAKRSVTLDTGIARVSVTKLGEVLVGVFKSLLRLGMRLADGCLSSVWQDDRMIALVAKVKRQFRFHRQVSPLGQCSPVGPVRSEDLDKLAETFPPCMAHLHRALRTRHRLKHFARVQYTLFLKELGLPLHEAIQFWRNEYSQTPVATATASAHSPCTHTWQDDGRRYAYSIRHLYGLEGARKNYRAHCCSSIQSQNPGYCAEGGCPFSHFDQEHLLRQLNQDSIPSGDSSAILDLTARGLYQEACWHHLVTRMRTLTSPSLWLRSGVGSDLMTSAGTEGGVTDSERRSSECCEPVTSAGVKPKVIDSGHRSSSGYCKPVTSAGVKPKVIDSSGHRRSSGCWEPVTSAGVTPKVIDSGHRSSSECCEPVTSVTPSGHADRWPNSSLKPQNGCNHLKNGTKRNQGTAVRSLNIGRHSHQRNRITGHLRRESDTQYVTIQYDADTNSTEPASCAGERPDGIAFVGVNRCTFLSEEKSLDSGYCETGSSISRDSAAGDIIMATNSKTSRRDSMPTQEMTSLVRDNHAIQNVSPGCYDHEVCPPSQTDAVPLNESGATKRKPLILPSGINKPIEYCVAYHKMFQALKS